jgi:hypothetical protein
MCSKSNPIVVFSENVLSKEAEHGFNETRAFFGSAKCLCSLVPTVIPYPEGSSLSLENFIFFFLRSNELLATTRMEKKNISDGQWLWVILCP